MLYHLLAILPAGRQKAITNKTEDEILKLVISFISSGTITDKWGEKNQTYQVYEMRIYSSKDKWNRKTGIPFEDFIRNKKDSFNKFKEKAENLLEPNKPRVFIIMPIQGKKSGSQNEQRIYKEYDDRYLVLRELLLQYNCIAIRIDKEHPIDQLVARIKEEIRKSIFVIADLTDERPSCYFEAGYAEGFKIPIIYIASEDSVNNPSQPTKIHFDVHMNVCFFSNHQELKELANETIEKNKDILLKKDEPITLLTGKWAERAQ